MDPAIPEPRGRHRSRPRRARVVTAISGTALLAAACIAVTAVSRENSGQGAQTVRLSAAAATALTANWYESAPYYSALDSAGPDLGTVMSATGQKAFDVSFILADGGCTAAWNGTDPVSGDTQVAAVINQVRSGGGDVIVSAGGYNGTKLGQVCGTAAATAAAYQQVIDTYGLHAFDFDLEEPEIENSAAIANELGAAQILQRRIELARRAERTRFHRFVDALDQPREHLAGPAFDDVRRAGLREHADALRPAHRQV